MQTEGVHGSPMRPSMGTARGRWSTGNARSWLVAGLVGLVAAHGVAVRTQTSTMQSTVPAAGGNITITAIQHASVQVEFAGKTIQVDPAQGDLAKAKPGD